MKKMLDGESFVSQITQQQKAQVDPKLEDNSFQTF